MPRINKLNNKEEIDNKGAIIIEDAINALLKQQDKVVLAIPGGRSVSGIFEKLKTKAIDWQKVHIFMIDERLVDISDPESNFLLAKKSFLNELFDSAKMPETNAHPFIFNHNISDYGTGNYEQELRSIGGKYDIILLSSGEDGHVGALYPHHHSISNCAEYFITMVDSPKLPCERISSSLNLLLTAKYGILLFLGEAKQAALNSFLNKNLNIEDCPAKLVDKIPDSWVLTDLQ